MCIGCWIWGARIGFQFILTFLIKTCLFIFIKIVFTLQRNLKKDNEWINLIVDLIWNKSRGKGFGTYFDKTTWPNRWYRLIIEHYFFHLKKNHLYISSRQNVCFVPGAAFVFHMVRMLLEKETLKIAFERSCKILGLRVIWL